MYIVLWLYATLFKHITYLSNYHTRVASGWLSGSNGALWCLVATRRWRHNGRLQRHSTHVAPSLSGRPMAWRHWKLHTTWVEINMCDFTLSFRYEPTVLVWHDQIWLIINTPHLITFSFNGMKQLRYNLQWRLIFNIVLLKTSLSCGPIMYNI